MNKFKAYGILVNKKVVFKDKLEDLDPNIFQDEDRVVKRTKVGNLDVSTVFLVINHGFLGKDLWFETMIFGPSEGDNQWRYETYEEAEAGHKSIVNQLKKGLI